MINQEKRNLAFSVTILRLMYMTYFQTRKRKKNYKNRSLARAHYITNPHNQLL